MSARHPIVAITGSSGAGTTTVTRTLQHIFRREKIDAALVEGDAFHRYDRAEMRHRITDAHKTGRTLSHFGPEANLFAELESLFKRYGESGGGRIRKYIHDEDDAARLLQQPGTFTPWQDLPAGTDMLFYEGLHGGVVAGEVDEFSGLLDHGALLGRGSDGDTAPAAELEQPLVP